jgi:hypothetical protein
MGYHGCRLRAALVLSRAMPAVSRVQGRAAVDCQPRRNVLVLHPDLHLLISRIRLLEYVRAGRYATAGRIGMGLLRDYTGQAAGRAASWCGGREEAGRGDEGSSASEMRAAAPR